MKETQEKQLGFKYLTVRGNMLVVERDRERRKPLPNPKLDEWFERDVAETFDATAQTWIKSRGSSIASAAGMNVTEYSDDGELNYLRNSLIEIFTSSNGYHFVTEDIVEKFRKRAKLLEHNSGQTGWGNSFTQDLIDDLGEARGLSETHIKDLKRGLLQTKLELRLDH